MFRRSLWYCFLAVIMVVLGFRGDLPKATTRVQLMLPEIEQAIGEGDDPGARERWEWERLHDPATGEIPDNIREKELAFAKFLPSRDELATTLYKSTGRRVAAPAWVSRGPYNVGGRTRALALDVANPSIMLAGGVSGGVWRSTDAGNSWIRTTRLDEPIQSVSCIVQDTRLGKTNTWYYGTGELIGNSAAGGGAPYRGDGLYKSTDNGVTWKRLFLTAPSSPQSFNQTFQYVFNLAVDISKMNQDVLYAATIDAIQRSTDGGESWVAVKGSSAASTLLTLSRYTDVIITPSGVLYATLSAATNTPNVLSPDKGVYRSTDGLTWTNITPAAWPTTYNRVVIGVAPSNQNVVYFLGDTPGSGFLTNFAGSNNYTSFWKYTYLSGDGAGANGTWENRSAYLPNFGGTGSFASQGGYDLVVRVKPDNENVVFVGGTSLFRSLDGFATATYTTWIGGYGFSSHHPDQHMIVFHPTNAAIMYTGSDGGIHRTDNDLNSPVSWTSLNRGYLTSQFYAIAIDHSSPGDKTIIGGTQDNGTWFTAGSNPTATWPSILGGDGAVCAIADGATSYYASSQNGVVYRLVLDDIGNLIDYARVQPRGTIAPQFVNPFILDPNNVKKMFFIDGGIVWRNNDLTGVPTRLTSQSTADATTAVNWDSLSNTRVSGTTYTAIAGAKVPANRLYLGSSGGRLYRIDNANAASPTLNDIYSGKSTPAAFVSCIAVDPLNADRALAVFSNYSVISLYYTSDAGANWTAVAGNLEQNTDGSGSGPSCRWATIVPSGNNRIYLVGTSVGLFSTTTLNGMQTLWAQEGASTIGNAVVDMIDSRPSEGYVVVGTHGNGIFSSNVVTSVEDVNTVSPGQYTLEQNYPNPFNPQTKITFKLAQSEQVKLRVYDILGKEIALLVDARLVAGAHEAQWDASRFPSGAYYYRLDAGTFSETRKAVLIK